MEQRMISEFSSFQLKPDAVLLNQQPSDNIIDHEANIQNMQVNDVAIPSEEVNDP